MMPSPSHPQEGRSASVSNRSACARFEVGKTAPVRQEFRFPDWLKRVSPAMTWDWEHQKKLYDALERVTRGECKRLMIFLPPRHGKSEMVTVRYTAFRMAQDPTLNVVLGSYNQRLADRFSRKVRRVLADDMALRSLEKARAGNNKPATAATGPELPETSCSHKKCDKCGCRFRREGSSRSSQPADRMAAVRPANSLAEWETAEGGGCRAVGVGAGVTGFGASLIVIDDPVKNRAEAESRTYREKVAMWLNDDVYTRLEPDGAIIIIQTRWHEDDLSGRLLKEMAEGGEQWDVVALPALAEDGDPLGRRPGEALCPSRYDEKALEKVRRKLGSYSFESLYQQHPTPLDGGLFKRAWFGKVIDRLPPGVTLVRAYDLAVSTRTTADYTVSVLAGFDRQGTFYIADVMRKRIEFPEQKRFVIDRLRRETRIQHGIELALHGQALVQELRRIAGVRGSALRGVRVDSDKVTRALAWAALAEEGRLVLVRGHWLRDFIDEVSKFPNGKHDDQIDAVSLALKMSRQSRFKHGGF